MDIPLGKHFPGKDKNTFADKSITPKIIVKINAKGTTPPKEKYFLIVNVDKNNDKVEGFYINSKITDFARKRPELFELHLEIKPKDYLFLKRKSFIDYSKIKIENYSYIYTDLIENPSWVDGFVKTDDLKKLKDKVKKSSLYNPGDKNLINKL